MKKRLMFLLGAVLITNLIVATSFAEEGKPITINDPELMAVTEPVYDNKCAICHGPKGSGSAMGPPLVHKIYEPNHHADMSFKMAIKNGVRAHHWDFGDMPPVGDMTEEQVNMVIYYIRSLQFEAGIFKLRSR